LLLLPEITCGSAAYHSADFFFFWYFSFSLYAQKQKSATILEILKQVQDDVVNLG